MPCKPIFQMENKSISICYVETKIILEKKVSGITEALYFMFVVIWVNYLENKKRLHRVRSNSQTYAYNFPIHSENTKKKNQTPAEKLMENHCFNSVNKTKNLNS